MKTTLENIPFPSYYLKDNPMAAIRLLINRYLVGDHRWTPRFLKNGTYRTLGQCNYTDKTIAINRDYVKSAENSDILNTILHEIAHAIAYCRYGCSQGHNNNWKSICVEIGANPRRVYKGSVKLTFAKKAKYFLVDKRTNKILKTYYRQPKHHIMVNIDRCILGGDRSTKGNLEFIRA